MIGGSGFAGLGSASNLDTLPISTGISYSRNYGGNYGSSGKDITSAATAIDNPDTSYHNGKWYFAMEVENTAASVRNPDDSDPYKYKSLDGSHNFTMEETKGANEMDHPIGEEEWAVSATPSSQSDIPYVNTIEELTKAAISNVATPVGIAFDAADIYNAYRADTSGTGDGVNSLQYEWTNLYAENKFSHYVAWDQTVPPASEADSNDYEINIDCEINGIPTDDDPNGTTTYYSSWIFNFPIMAKPENMTQSEKEKYGIEKVSNNQTTQSGFSTSNTQSNFIAKNPPKVKVEKKKHT